jgi:hypothetical protein
MHWHLRVRYADYTLWKRLTEPCWSKVDIDSDGGVISTAAHNRRLAKRSLAWGFASAPVWRENDLQPASGLQNGLLIDEAPGRSRVA